MSQPRVRKFKEAIDEALVQAMDDNPDVFIMGCGVDDDSGIFGTTVSAFKKFGKERVMDVPLAENAIAGIGVGAALMKKRPVIVHARNDFLLLAMDQIINHACKWNIMSGGRLNCPLLIRAIVGRGWGQAAQHSQSLQALFSHVPGLKVLLPSSAYDVKGLLLSALEDRGTVLSIEHRLLYEIEEEVPEARYRVAIGEGEIKRPGGDCTIVAFSYMVQEALKAADILQKEGIDVEVVDPRCSSPLDMPLILSSAKKTKRVLVADTGWTSFGISAEVSARLHEELFHVLEAPVRRIALPDKNTPCSSNLEKEYYPGVEEIVSEARLLVRSHQAEEMQNASHSAEHSTFKGPF